MIVCFILGILYEGLKFLRDFIYTKNVEVKTGEEHQSSHQKRGDQRYEMNCH